MAYCIIDSPIGNLLISEDHDLLTGIRCTEQPVILPQNPVLKKAVSQLCQYFSGTRCSFDLPLAPASTPFQQRVREAMLSIPYGGSATYGEIARRIGTPGGSRAVGQACHNNPLMIVVPCHRVIASGGKPGGFAYGPAVKKQLQSIENNDKNNSEDKDFGRNEHSGL